MKSGTVSLHIAADHPVGAGHFPGNPIVPGALLLAEVVRLLETELSARFASCHIKSAKFFHPARPGDTVEIEFSVSPRNEVSFQGAVAGTKVLAGVLDAATGA